MLHIIYLISVLPSIMRPFSRISYVFFSCVLLVFLSIRYDFGNDYLHYFGQFNIGFNPDREHLFYYFLNSFESFYYFVALSTLIFFISLYPLVISVVKNYFIFLVFFIINPYTFTLMLGSFRQFLSLVFIFLSVYIFLKSKRLVLSFLLLIPAFFFHMSSIIFFIFFLFSYHRKLRYETIIWLFLFLIIPFISLGGVYQEIVSFVSDYANLSRYLVYAEPTLPSIKTVISSSTISLSILFLFYRFQKNDYKSLMLFRLSLLSCVFLLLSMHNLSIIRLYIYFAFFIPFLLSRIRLDKINTMVIFLIFSIYFARYFNFFNDSIYSSKFVYNTFVF